MNNWYIQDGTMTLRSSGWWTDAGTFESLHQPIPIAEGGANKMD